jgi:methionine biosynthesis protein MetW
MDARTPSIPVTREGQRLDLLLVASMVEPGSRVLDVGCGDGALLALLRSRRNVDGRGIELSREGVSECLAKGLPVIQGDADTDLADYPDDAFDYVILSQTIQATRRPRVVLEHMLRIGRRAIVSFPNFGHWRIRYEVALRGRMPMTENLPHAWYETPNIHFCTIRDFVALCRVAGARMERAVALDGGGQPIRVNLPWWFWNLFGEQAVFLLRRGGAGRRSSDALRQTPAPGASLRAAPEPTQKGGNIGRARRVNWLEHETRVGYKTTPAGDDRCVRAQPRSRFATERIHAGVASRYRF